MGTSLKISVGQFDALEDKQHNLAAITKLAEAAAEEGSRVLIVPEGAMYHRESATIAEGVANAEAIDGPFVNHIRELSKRHGLFIAAGMSKIGRGADEGKRAINVLLLVDAGEIVEEYEKIHLYDAFSMRESDSVVPGDGLPPVVDIDGVKVGFAICYDLRFPELFRVLADRGAEVIALSAAWVRGVLKEEHWLTLLRARAIENTCYVFASDEASGVSVGRSVIFDPLGVQLGDAGEQKLALITATASADRVRAVRGVVPSLRHRRFDVVHSVNSMTPDIR